MLQTPANYTLDIPDPSKALMQGFQTGMAMEEMQLQQQAKELELQRRQELQKRTMALIDKPNPTARDYTNLATLLPEKEAASLRNNFELLNKDQKDNDLRFGGQVMSAFSAGSPQIGIKLLRDRATAERNSGREDQAQQYETLASLAEIDPNSGKAIIGTHLGALPGGDKVLENAIKIQKAPVEVRNIESQIDERSARLDLDRDKLQSEYEFKVTELSGKNPKLEPDARKIVNESTLASVAGEQTAFRTLDLAQRIESAGGGTGAITKTKEQLQRAFGNQNEFTLLRQEYTRLRNAQAIKALPPGVATDRDIQLALEGFPEATTNAETLASFLRGVAKMQQYEATTKSAEAEWVNATGTLGRARNDFMIGDIQVPAGSTFTDFMRQFGDKRATQLGVQQGQANVPQRSYMRHANPQQ